MAAVDDVNNLTWRTLNREGCELGRSLQRAVEEQDVAMKDLAKRVDRLTWALAGAAITFGTAAVMLALNLLT